MSAVLDPRNLIVMLANVMVFMAVQTLFFDKVASRQFDEVLKDKTGIYTTWVSLDDFRTASLRAKLARDDSTIRNKRAEAMDQAQRRDRDNWALFARKVGVPLAVVAIVVVGLVVVMFRRKTPWTTLDTTMLSLVLAAYVTELLFFFGIVRRYEFYSDQEIYFNILNETENRLAALS